MEVLWGDRQYQVDSTPKLREHFTLVIKHRLSEQTEKAKKQKEISVPLEQAILYFKIKAIWSLKQTHAFQTKNEVLPVYSPNCFTS